MVYDQNRPDESQRPPGDDRPARRRIGRSWGPPAQEPAEAEAERPEMGQAPEQYRFDPDRGRRHRYSEEPTGQMPGIPVEIAETGPMVPATRRPSPGEQFEPIPPAPQAQQGSQGDPQQAQQQAQQQSPFAPPPGSQEYSAPSMGNQEYSAQPGGNHEYSAPQQQYQGPPQEYSAPPPANEYSAPPQTPQPGGPQQVPHQGLSPQTNQPLSAPPANPEFASPQQGQQFPAAPSAPQHPQTGPLDVPPQMQSAPSQEMLQHPRGAPPTPAPQQPAPSNEQTEQFPVVAPQPVTEVHPTAVPSPPVTEQAPLRTPPASRQPMPEPTPPASFEKARTDYGRTGTSEPADPESARLLEAVRGVHGVRDAFHVTAPDGAPSLRLELEEGVDPDEVHTAVSAVVAEQRAFDPGPQTLDDPIEEVPGEIEAPPAEIPAVGKVELSRVEIDSSGLEAEVSVTLSFGDAESTGTALVPPIDWHLQRAAAMATVEALRPHLGGGDVRIEVEHASIVPTGPVKTAVVVILWLDGHAVRRLAGAAVVTAERSRAVVSATLGALAAEVAH